VTDDSDLSGFAEVVTSGALTHGTDHKIDHDVNKERHRIDGIFERKQLNVKQHAIFIHRLSKIYYGRGAMKTKIAVKEFNLAVSQGEVFGLLGANGAGKTTLLKMVSGLEEPTSGNGVINGFDVVSQTSKAQRSMGLCPQFDTLVERYSVRENLYFFASIKGIDEDSITAVVEAFMKALNIKKYENKLIQHLSGGNRRKVSLAVALLGCPPTVYLDEPSTGLDPVASRLMWRLLTSIAAKKSSAIVLTTHNMLECEAVCTRVGVMKNGELVCLGSSQHLRSIHGTGFLLEVVLSTHDATAIAILKQFVDDSFTNAAIVDEHGSMINYEIPRTSIKKLSEAFRLLESNKQRLSISDYSLSQSSLEQVFLKQIRPTNAESTIMEQQRIGGVRVPTGLDYFFGYLIWFLAFFIPGLHHFYLGNTARGLKYLFTINEFFVGWFLDLFELHMLIRKSVDEFGNARCCGCCRKEPFPVGPETASSYVAPDVGEQLN
jgi:ABC-type multidrug transport system ATPase subunit/TM2 domain-containing membrane protein YozV